MFILNQTFWTMQRFSLSSNVSISSLTEWIIDGCKRSQDSYRQLWFPCLSNAIILTSYNIVMFVWSTNDCWTDVILHCQTPSFHASCAISICSPSNDDIDCRVYLLFDAWDLLSFLPLFALFCQWSCLCLFCFQVWLACFGTEFLWKSSENLHSFQLSFGQNSNDDFAHLMVNFV
jgi:hypothetical protein